MAVKRIKIAERYSHLPTNGAGALLFTRYDGQRVAVEPATIDRIDTTLPAWAIYPDPLDIRGISRVRHYVELITGETIILDRAWWETIVRATAQAVEPAP